MSTSVMSENVFFLLLLDEVPVEPEEEEEEEVFFLFLPLPLRLRRLKYSSGWRGKN